MSPSHDDLNGARVEARQMPIFARDAKTVCLELGLTIEDARRMHQDDLISFDPVAQATLDEMHEAELTFVGALVGAGCTRPVLRALLRGLHKPYCYDISRIFYDWRQTRWRMQPGEDDPVGAFFGLLDRLHDREERDTLVAIREWVDEALDLNHDRATLFSHEGSIGGRARGDGSETPGGC